MKLIFAGTPEFARVALESLHRQGHDIALVLTQPDRPGGRGLKLQASAVKQFALQNNLPLCQPRSLRLDGKYPEDAAAARWAIEGAQAEVMVVAAYGLILPEWLLASFKHGCLNIHASVLPRWRGAAPIHRAIEAGDSETGITLMQMDAGLDTGDMLRVEKLPIMPTDSTGELHDKLALLGAQMIVRTLDQAQAGRLTPAKQPETGLTYAKKIDKAETAICWMQDAGVIVRRILAFNPAPGASAVINGETLKIWRAEVSTLMPPQTATVGQIIATGDTGISVKALNSVVTLTQLQRAGGKRLAAGEFLRGSPLKVGDCFESTLPLHPATSP